MAGACYAYDDPRIGIRAPPGSEEAFGPVSDMLDQRCGTLDCHGQTGRNLQMWGCSGMRLDPKLAPSCSKLQGGGPSTVDEHFHTYRSLVGLEPNVISTVYAGCVDAGGVYPPGSSCHPELLTFVRKARGTEAHKGGQLISVLGVDGGPDPQDVCIVTWLEGQTNVQSCNDARISIPTFPIPDASSE
jgi:hypothetical protein